MIKNVVFDFGGCWWIGIHITFTTNTLVVAKKQIGFWRMSAATLGISRWTQENLLPRV